MEISEYLSWARVPISILIGLFCALATLIVFCFSGRRVYHQAIVHGAMPIVLSVLLAFIVSISFSRMYWGYFLWRPAMPSLIREIGQVKKVTPISSIRNAKGEFEITEYWSEKWPLKQRLEYRRNDRYYGELSRVCYYLESKGMLNVAEPRQPHEYTDLHRIISSTGFLFQPSEGYTDSDQLTGEMIEAELHNGTPIIVFSVAGMDVSNDHRPFYEMVFEGRIGRPLKYIDGTRFFYDVAGMEGFEWYVVFAPLSAAIALLSTPAWGFVIFRNEKARRRRLADDAITLSKNHSPA